jgi:dipeptidyl aminopeptidase/acylaminoacyl peptidase
MFNRLSDVAFITTPPAGSRTRAAVLTFHGLGYTSLRSNPEVDELELAANGAICVFPYYGPWSWMNANARSLVDEIVRRVYADYGLPDDVPLILRGGSMGGFAALLYARYAAKEPTAVAANYPVTDPRYHLTERDDLPRTFINAYGLTEQSLDSAMHENSPLEQAATMPKVPYLIIHGTADLAVNKAMHSDLFVPEMRKYGHDVTYVEAEGMGHGAFVEYAVYRRYQDFVLQYFLK